DLALDAVELEQLRAVLVVALVPRHERRDSLTAADQEARLAIDAIVEHGHAARIVQTGNDARAPRIGLRGARLPVLRALFRIHLAEEGLVRGHDHAPVLDRRGDRPPRGRIGAAHDLPGPPALLLPGTVVRRPGEAAVDADLAAVAAERTGSDQGGVVVDDPDERLALLEKD